MGDESRSQSELMLQAFFMSSFTVIGLLGNLAAIFVIVVLKEYQKSVTHWYVLQLSIAGSLFLLTVPFKITESLRDGWIFSEWMCKANETILFLNYYASILFLTIMSIDRYIAVCRPFSSRLQRLRRRSSAFIIAMTLWGISLLLCIPIMLYSFKVGLSPFCKCTYEFKEEDVKGKSCYDDRSISPEALKSCLNDNQTNFYSDVFTNPDEKRCLIASANVLEGFSGLFESTEFQSYLSEFEYNNENYDNTFHNAQDDLGSYSISDSSNISSISSLGLDSDLSTDLTLDSETDLNFDLESIKGRSLDSQVEPTTSSFEVGCYNGSNGEGWIAFVLFNFLAMFIIPLLIMCLCYGLIVYRLFRTRMTRTTSTSSAVSFTQSFNNGTGGSQKRKRKLTARSDKDRIRVTLMYSTLVVSFLVLWLPFHSLHLAKLQGIPYGATFCTRFARASVIFAYFTAVINPYLYSFLGTRFAKRWNSATRTVRKSIAKRRRSSSSAGSNYYLQRRATSVNQTCVSKLNKTDTNPKLFTATVDQTECQPPSPDKKDKNSLSGSPPPDYESFLEKRDREEKASTP